MWHYLTGETLLLLYICIHHNISVCVCVCVSISLSLSIYIYIYIQSKNPIHPEITLMNQKVCHQYFLAPKHVTVLSSFPVFWCHEIAGPQLLLKKNMSQTTQFQFQFQFHGPYQAAKCSLNSNIVYCIVQVKEQA